MSKYKKRIAFTQQIYKYFKYLFFVLISFTVVVGLFPMLYKHVDKSGKTFAQKQG